MNNQPLISVIIITYNRVDYIVKAIESVLNQNYQNIELIVVDDGSTDKTKDFVKPYLDNKQIYYIYQKNRGVSIARNNGIKNSNGKYVAILDSDDFWHDKEKLQKQTDFLEKNSKYGLVGGGIIKISRKGKEIVRCLFPEKDENIRKLVLINNLFAHSTVLFRRDVFEKVGGYDEHFAFLEDWDLWLKIGRISKFYNFQEFFSCYLDHEYDNPNYAIRNRRTRRQIKLNIELRKKHKNDYPHYKKAILFCWADYFFSFLPFKQKLRSMLLKAKILILNFSVYEKK